MHPEVQTLVDIFAKSGYRGELVPSTKLTRVHHFMMGLQRPVQFRATTDIEIGDFFREDLKDLYTSEESTNTLRLTGRTIKRADQETYHTIIPGSLFARVLHSEEHLYDLRKPLNAYLPNLPYIDHTITHVHTSYVLSLVGFPREYNTHLKEEYTPFIQGKRNPSRCGKAYFGLDVRVSEADYETAMALLKEKPWILNDVLLHLTFFHTPEGYCGITQDPATLIDSQCSGFNVYDAFVLPPFICDHSLQGALNISKSGELITDLPSSMPFPHFNVQIVNTRVGESTSYYHNSTWPILPKEHRREGEFW